MEFKLQDRYCILVINKISGQLISAEFLHIATHKLGHIEAELYAGKKSLRILSVISRKWHLIVALHLYRSTKLKLNLFAKGDYHESGEENHLGSVRWTDYA